MIRFKPLQHVRMTADDEIGTGVNVGTGQFLLVIDREVHFFLAPMGDYDDEVGFGTCRANRLDSAGRVVRDGESRLVFAGVPTDFRYNPTEAEERDGDAVSLDQHRGVCAGCIRTGADIGDLVFIQYAHRVKQAFHTLVHGMVVRQVDQVNPGCFHRRYSFRGRLVHIGLGSGCSARSHGCFQIDDGNIVVLKQRCNVHKRKVEAILPQPRFHVAGHHRVSRKAERDGRIAACR